MRGERSSIILSITIFIITGITEVVRYLKKSSIARRKTHVRLSIIHIFIRRSELCTNTSLYCCWPHCCRLGNKRYSGTPAKVLYSNYTLQKHLPLAVLFLTAWSRSPSGAPSTYKYINGLPKKRIMILGVTTVTIKKRMNGQLEAVSTKQAKSDDQW
jgi:hypothetical protein